MSERVTGIIRDGRVYLPVFDVNAECTRCDLGRAAGNDCGAACTCFQGERDGVIFKYSEELTKKFNNAKTS